MHTVLFTYNDLQMATSGKWNSRKSKQENSFSTINGINSISTDTRKDNNNSLFLAISGDNFDAHIFLKEAIDSGAAALCLQKGKYDIGKIPLGIPVLEVQDTLKAYQNIANFHRKRFKALTLIAITGSNGKTSTKDILHCILSTEFGEESVYTTKANTNNLIGVPQNILNLREKHRFAVIELGSNHPGEISQLTKIANPDIAVITSIGPSHLEYFKDISGVLKEKSDIFIAYNNSPKNTAIVPIEYKDYNIVSQKSAKCQLITFGKNLNADISCKQIQTTIDKCKFELFWKTKGIKEVVSWTIPGIHQMYNATAAAAVATTVGISPKNITNALQNCRISGMRMRINKIEGVTWINDAYNANPSSTKAGIDWLQKIAIDTSSKTNKNLFVILGDMLELGEKAPEIHKEIIEYTLTKLPCSKIIVVGSIMSKVIAQFNSNTELSASNIAQNLQGYDNEKTSHFIIKSFHNSDKAASFLENKFNAGDIIYLKGSRGIALEKIEQTFKDKL